MVTYICNLSMLGGRGRRVTSLSLSWATYQALSLKKKWLKTQLSAKAPPKKQRGSRRSL